MPSAIPVLPATQPYYCSTICCAAKFSKGEEFLSCFCFSCLILVDPENQQKQSKFGPISSRLQTSCIIVPYKKQSPVEVGSACTRKSLGSVSPTPVSSAQKMLRLIQFAVSRPGRLSISPSNHDGDCAMRSCLRTAECTASCSEQCQGMDPLPASRPEAEAEAEAEPEAEAEAEPEASLAIWLPH
eukprot:2372954-Rhodomonas_salina.2